MIYTTLYNHLKSQEGLKEELVHSGFQNKRNKDYLTISKLAGTLDRRDTCLTRHETHVFSFNLHKNSKIVRKYIEDALNWQNLSGITNIQLSSFEFSQPAKEHYLYQLIYEFTVETLKSNFLFETTEGNDLFQALYNRFKANNDLISLVKGFTTDRFGKNKWGQFGYLYIPNYEGIEDFLTTCSRHESIRFSIALNDSSPVKIETVLNQVDKVFSYCRLKTNDFQDTKLEWLGDSLVELSPNLWQGMIEYEFTYERNII